VRHGISGVTNTSKIQSESNSQPEANPISNQFRCHQYLKDTIWKQFTTKWPRSCHKLTVSPIPQRYNLKAIHNWLSVHLFWLAGVTNTSKIQSESNSQLISLFLVKNLWCHQYLKDTIWKQFTTVSWIISWVFRCHQYLKDTIWKQFTTPLCR